MTSYIIGALVLSMFAFVIGHRASGFKCQTAVVSSRYMSRLCLELWHIAIYDIFDDRPSML